MLIIIEGADGNGKTTLAKHICDVYPFHNYVKISPTIHTTLKEYERMVKDKKITYVLDRSFISDIAYRTARVNTAVDGFTRTEYPLKDMIDFLYKYSSKIKLVHCDIDDAYKIMKERGDTNIKNKSQHQKVTNAYRYFFDMISVSTFFDIFVYTDFANMRGCAFSVVNGQ